MLSKCHATLCQDIYLDTMPAGFGEAGKSPWQVVDVSVAVADKKHAGAVRIISAISKERAPSSSKNQSNAEQENENMFYRYYRGFIKLTNNHSLSVLLTSQTQAGAPRARHSTSSTSNSLPVNQSAPSFNVPIRPQHMA